MPHVPGRGRAGGVLRRDGRRRHRLPLVQHPPRPGVHGRRRRAGAGRRASASSALATKTELALPIIGGVFVAEAVSDIIQVAYYKMTRKRVFLMAPIHHHFEKLGWPESQNRGAFLDRVVRLRDSRPHHHPQGEMRPRLDLTRQDACWWSVSGVRDRGGAAVRGARRARDRHRQARRGRARRRRWPSCRPTSRASSGGHRRETFTGAELIVLSPGRPRDPGAGGGARRRRADHRRDGAGVALRGEHADRDHRHQRQVDDDDAGRAT